MNYKCFYVAIVLISHSMIGLVLNQKNLCLRKVKIDSISFIKDRKQWFFTSGGNFWLLKDDEMRNFNKTSLGRGRPLPAPFKRGDAAVYKDSLHACQGVSSGKAILEQEVIVVELTDKGNMIMIYDLRDFTWKPAHLYNQDRSIGQARVYWPERIDAMFVYKRSQIFVIQQNRYAAIDYLNLCHNPDEFSHPSERQENFDFETKDSIDAITMIDENHFYMFQGNDFYEGTITSEEHGRVHVIKEPAQNIVDKFLNYKDQCLEITNQPEPHPTQPPAQDHSQTDAAALPEQPGLQVTTDDGNQGSQSLLWIIIVIIVIIIIIIILLIVFMATRNKSSSPAGRQESTVGAAKGVSATASSVEERGSPSKTSVRTNAGVAGGKASPFAGSSPSRMSVRSHMEVAPVPAVTTKSKAVPTSADKNSSIAKSSVSKR